MKCLSEYLNIDVIDVSAFQSVFFFFFPHSSPAREMYNQLNGRNIALQDHAYCSAVKSQAHTV